MSKDNSFEDNLGADALKHVKTDSGGILAHLEGTQNEEPVEERISTQHDPDADIHNMLGREGMELILGREGMELFEKTMEEAAKQAIGEHTGGTTDADGVDWKTADGVDWTAAKPLFNRKFLPSKYHKNRPMNKSRKSTKEYSKGISTGKYMWHGVSYKQYMLWKKRLGLLQEKATHTINQVPNAKIRQLLLNPPKLSTAKLPL